MQGLGFNFRDLGLQLRGVGFKFRDLGASVKGLRV